MPKKRFRTVQAQRVLVRARSAIRDAVVLLACCCATTSALAQAPADQAAPAAPTATAPALAPPPATTQPPPAYPPSPYPPAAYPQYPPPGYAPPPGYPPPTYPPQTYPYPPAQPPLELPYRAGQPIPPGYRLREEPRWGLVTGGYILAGIPYGLSIVAATTADFENETLWLVVPFAGPWMTLGRRDYADNCDNSSDPQGSEGGLDCVGDVFAVMGLVFDGILQLGGGTMLLLGYTLEKKTLVRQLAITVTPGHVGSGKGLVVSGAF
jgi:hypothetical protein